MVVAATAAVRISALTTSMLLRSFIRLPFFDRWLDATGAPSVRAASGALSTTRLRHSCVGLLVSLCGLIAACPLGRAGARFMP
jgi:hypothetical protein